MSDVVTPTSLFAAALLFTAVASTACSNPLTSNPLVGERGSMSCDFRTASQPEQVCTDYASVGVGQSSFKATCEAKKGTVGSSCPRDGVLGGCNAKNTDGQDNDSTRWYYATPDGGAAEDVQKLCQSNETFVNP